MTTNATTDTVSVTTNSGETITVKLEDTTDVVRALLLARKEGYEARRVAKAAKNAEAKAAKAKAAADREVARNAKRNARLEKLRKQLAELENPTAKKAAGKKVAAKKAA
jgi:hypothetical protein